MNESILLLIRQVYASAEQYGRRQLHAWGLSPAQAFVLDSLLGQLSRGADSCGGLELVLRRLLYR